MRTLLLTGYDKILHDNWIDVSQLDYSNIGPTCNSLVVVYKGLLELLMGVQCLLAVLCSICIRDTNRWTKPHCPILMFLSLKPFVRMLRFSWMANLQWQEWTSSNLSDAYQYLFQIQVCQTTGMATLPRKSHIEVIELSDVYEYMSSFYTKISENYLRLFSDCFMIFVCKALR